MDLAPVFIALVFLVALFAPLIPVRRRRQAGLAGFPIITAGLLFINVICFAASLDSSGHLRTDVVREFALTPQSPHVLALLTHMFLHASWLHLIGNMIGLWLFGPHVEEALDRLEYLLFYLASGVAAGLLHLFITDWLLRSSANAPLVGASGAIFGILGLFSVRFWRAHVRVLLLFTIPAVWAVGVFAAIQAVQGLMAIFQGKPVANVASWAHVGGFLFGMLLAIPLKMRRESAREYGMEDAETARKEGKLDRAAAHYRAVLALAPEDIEAHLALARVCILMRQDEAAYRHMMDALKLNLRSDGSPVTTARIYGEAMENFEHFPLSPATLQRVASACEEAQQYALAVKALSDLCRNHSEAREAEMSMIRLGKLHLHKLNQPQNAVGVFSEFLRLYPESDFSGHALRLRDEAARDLY